MRFTKMHGIGNDYLFVDCFQEKFPSDPAGLARRISDRHTGVGSDGLIFICPSEVAAARMRMFNADGSEAEMCGNGVRCVAKYVYDHGIQRQPQLKIETGAGVLTLDLEVAAGKVERVRVDMGTPILAPAEIPVDLSATRGSQPPAPPGDRPLDQIVNLPLEPYIQLKDIDGWIAACGLDPRMTCVSVGNPHLVLYCRHVSAVPLAIVGPSLETHPIFPRRINVHFVEVHSPAEVTMRTWERGSGITLACGTGATAVCVAGSLAGHTDRQILAHLPGGDLELEWTADNHIYMTGPAAEVFSAEWSS